MAFYLIEKEGVKISYFRHGEMLQSAGATAIIVILDLNTNVLDFQGTSKRLLMSVELYIAMFKAKELILPSKDCCQQKHQRQYEIQWGRNEVGSQGKIFT